MFKTTQRECTLKLILDRLTTLERVPNRILLKNNQCLVTPTKVEYHAQVEVQVTYSKKKCFIISTIFAIIKLEVTLKIILHRLTTSERVAIEKQSMVDCYPFLLTTGNLNLKVCMFLHPRRSYLLSSVMTLKCGSKSIVGIQPLQNPQKLEI